jgi:hypothetical protein
LETTFPSRRTAWPFHKGPFSVHLKKLTPCFLW